MSKAEAEVQELVGMIQRGELRLPEMQRRFVWTSTRVRDLLDSLYRGYPSGAILLWETDEEVPLQPFAVSQSSNPYGTTRLLLDGQQRLTSLSSVLRGEPVRVRNRQRPIEILFNLEHPEKLEIVTEVNEEADDDDDGVDDTTDSSEDELQTRVNKMAFVVATQKLAALPQWVKVSEIFKVNEDAPFLKRAGITTLDDPRYTKYSQRLARVRAVRRYVYRMDVLERSLSYDEVTEIFVRVNSLGAKLRSSDLALAQITAKWRGALAVFQGFETECAKGGFELDLAIHLKNLVAFATGQSRFLTVASLTLDQLQKAWAECRSGMDFAINFVKSNAGFDSPTLLSSPFLLVTMAYYGHRRGYQVSGDEASRLCYWARIANAKGRYSRGSSETLLDQDLATLRDGGTVDLLIERLRLQVGRLDITPEELTGRNQRSSLFKTMFVAFREADARDWMSSLKISLSHSGTQHKLQFHHIFPKALLQTMGRPPRDADDIANLAFISGGTNRKISDKAPNVYLAGVKQEDRRAFFASQCIPDSDELLDPARYDDFLAARRQLIADRLNDFLDANSGGSYPQQLGPQAAALDRRVHSVELALRELVRMAIAEDDSIVPSHVRDGVERRVAADMSQRSGATDGPIPWDAKVGYFDLRELQDLIMSGAGWPRFQARFGRKEVLQSRFAQLASLRNVLRHSRPLDDVTRQDGLAALGWFDGALKRR